MTKPIHFLVAFLAGSLSLEIRAQSIPEPANKEPVNNNGSDRPVMLTPFSVSETLDKGYVAGNSVSATRISVPIGNLPFAVSAFTPMFITDIHAEKLLDIVSYASGVKSGLNNLQLGDSIFTIRGFPQSPQHNGFYNSPLVNNFVDPAVITRVEVIKGPASLLYGQVSPGGTINYITKSPMPVASTQVTAEMGSYNFMRSTLDLNRPLIGDTLLFRFVGAYEKGFEYTDFAKNTVRMLSPMILWNVSPTVSLSASYQWYNRHEYAPTNYDPPVELATPASMVAAFYGAGFPSPTAMLQNKTGPAVAAGFSDGSDPGFMGIDPLLPKTFNFASAHDTRTSDQQSLNLEGNAKFGEHWSGRANFAYDTCRLKGTSTGVANALLAPPDSLVYSNGVWSVAPTWLAMSGAQQVATALTFANQAVNNPGLLLATQNGTPAPIVFSRPPRVQERWALGKTIQVEAVGDYDFGWAKIKPLIGVSYDAGYEQIRLEQNTGNAASPAFRTWDVNPASPTYYYNPYNPGYSSANLTVRNQFTSAFTSDQAAYAVLNSNFFHERLIVVAGLRYNRSQTQTINFNATGNTNPIGQGLKAAKTTPQVGIGYRITSESLLYASYSESYTLPPQPFTSTVGIVNGIPVSVPTGPSHPTTGKGYEAGIKTNLRNGRIAGTLSVYQIDQSDVLKTLGATINGIGVNTFVQGEQIRARGIEGEVTWSPLDNWQVFVSASEEDIRVIAETPGFEYYLGSTPNATAKTMVNLWTRYSFKATALKGFWVGGGGNYTGKSAGDPRNVAYFLPAYTLFNTAAGFDWKWHGKTGTAALNFKNMGGTFYKVTNNLQGEPRRITFSVTVNL